MKKSIKIVLAGNPNSGKSTIFNKLTKSKQKIGNYPGVTIEKKEGFLTFENTEIPYGLIQGRKYRDVNMNGDFDQEEKDAVDDPNRLDGWTIRLWDSQWGQVDEMVTGDDNTPAGNVGKGQYRFVNVEPGDYYVCEELKPDWFQTEPDNNA